MIGSKFVDFNRRKNSYTFMFIIILLFPESNLFDCEKMCTTKIFPSFVHIFMVLNGSVFF